MRPKHLNPFLGMVAFVAMGWSGGSIGQTTDEPDLPHLTFQLDPTAYSMESVAANEEGTTILEILIEPDASISEAEIRESSGFPSLDDAAIYAILRASLSTQPMLSDGTPTSARAFADVVWQLPLLPVDQFMRGDLPGGAPFDADDVIVMPSPAEGGNRVTVNDYPRLSVERREHGYAMLHVLIGTDGKV
jgi:TonB family protein